MQLYQFLKPFIFISLFTACLTSHAAVYEKMDLPLLAQKSDGLVHGTVSDIYSGFDEGDDLVTWVVFSDLEILSGSFTESTFTLKLCGGEYDGLAVHCSSYSDFDVGDEVYMYIKANADLGYSSLVGGTQGLFFVSSHADDREVITPDSHQLNLSPDNVAKDNSELDYVQEFDERDNGRPLGPPQGIKLKQDTSAPKRSLKKFLDTVKYLPTQYKRLRSASMAGLKSVNRRYPRLRHGKSNAHKHFEREFFATKTQQSINNIRQYYAGFGISYRDINKVIAKHRKDLTSESSMNRAKRKALIDALEQTLKSFITQDKYDAAVQRYKKGRQNAISGSDEQFHTATKLDEVR